MREANRLIPIESDPIWAVHSGLECLIGPCSTVPIQCPPPVTPAEPGRRGRRRLLLADRNGDSAAASYRRQKWRRLPMLEVSISFLWIVCRSASSKLLYLPGQLAPSRTRSKQGESQGLKCADSPWGDMAHCHRQRQIWPLTQSLVYELGDD